LYQNYDVLNVKDIITHLIKIGDLI